ncbi:outer membrane protein assembly factor BamB family protein [Streptomyces sp. NPDC003697]
MSFGPPPSPFTQSAVAADRAARRRRTTVLGGALAVVLAVAVCVGGRLLWSAGDHDAPAGDGKAAAAQRPDEVRETADPIPGSPEGRLLVDYSEDGLAGTVKGQPRYAPGTWATDKVVAKGIGHDIVGLTTGGSGDEKAWTLKLDGHLCATSRHITADGRTAVVVQPARPGGTKASGVCDEVVFFDVDTGKKLWQATMPSARSAFVTNTNVTLTRGVVAVAWGEGSVAYDMRTGRQLWNGTTASACEDSGFAGGRGLLALEKCGRAPDTTYRVEKLDPRTGRTEWTYELADGVQDVFLPSADPPVLAVAAGDSLVTDLITLDGHGKRLATVSMSGYDPGCGVRSMRFFGSVDRCEGVVVGPRQVYVVSEDNVEPAQAANWIVAFDLATGKSGRKFDGRPGEPLTPVRMNGDDLLVFRRSYLEVEPSAVVSWDPRTGRQTPFLLFGLPSDDAGQLGDAGRSDILVEGGRVFFAKSQLEADSESPDDPVRVVLGVGSAGRGD